MDTKLLILIAVITIILVGALILLVLPATTITTYASYGLDYEGYSLAISTGVGADGQPMLETSGPSFDSGEDVYLVIYGISGLQTENDVAKITMEMDLDGGAKTLSTDGSIDYPAAGGYIDNVYSYVEGSELQPGKHSISLTVADTFGGGYITVNAEFTVVGPLKS